MTDLLNKLLATRDALHYSPARSQTCHAIKYVRRAMRAKTQAGRDAALKAAIASIRLAREYEHVAA